MVAARRSVCGTSARRLIRSKIPAVLTGLQEWGDRRLPWPEGPSLLRLEERTGERSTSASSGARARGAGVVMAVPDHGRWPLPGENIDGLPPSAGENIQGPGTRRTMSLVMCPVRSLRVSRMGL